MEKEIKKYNLSKIVNFIFTLLFCLYISVFLKLMGYSHHLFGNIVMSLSIGILIFVFINVFTLKRKQRNRVFLWFLITTGIVSGSIIGWLVGAVLLKHFLQIEVSFVNDKLISGLVFWLCFAPVMIVFFYTRNKLTTTQTMMQEEREKRLLSEKAKVEANLRLLQAQIEPHFLFNTLSTILTLYETDATKGKSMLMDLMQFLRVTLSKTREETSTMRQEIDIIRAYLNIYLIRMGERLRFNIDIPETILDLAFPPMLIQPLVENAIKHGLEPSVKGGEIFIYGSMEGGIVRIEIDDTGQGFPEKSNPGVGLENIRTRLETLYGEDGKLILTANQPTGVKVRIEIPYDKDKSNTGR